jgi:hypothetical protein
MVIVPSEDDDKGARCPLPPQPGMDNTNMSAAKNGGSILLIVPMRITNFL